MKNLLFGLTFLSFPLLADTTQVTLNPGQTTLIHPGGDVQVTCTAGTLQPRVLIPSTATYYDVSASCDNLKAHTPISSTYEGTVLAKMSCGNTEYSFVQFQWGSGSTTQTSYLAFKSAELIPIQN